MSNFDYGASAELFIPKRKPKPPGYRRFASAAEAIRFAIEELPAVRSLAPWMRVGDEKFDINAIRSLYDNTEYPLSRA